MAVQNLDNEDAPIGYKLKYPHFFFVCTRNKRNRSFWVLSGTNFTIMQEKCSFNLVKKLYHYTSIKSALKILESKTLKFSELNRMNDINESSKSIFYELPPLLEKGVKNFSLNIEIEEEISKCRQISLTMDGNKRGFYIPAMWAHYANKGEGLCIVLDRNKLLNKIPANIEHHKVCYSDDYDNNVTIPYNGVSEYLRVNSKEFFFTKTTDWSYEQEYRLFSFDSGIEDISIESCVVAVIMLYTDGVRCGESVTKSVDYGILNKIAKSIPILQIMQFHGDISLVDEKSNAVWESNPINYDDIGK